MKKLFVAYALVFTITSCENTTPNPEDLRQVEFMPNACSEPWDAPAYTESNDNRGSRMVAYLKDNGIKNVYKLSSKNDGKIYCAACNCPSGEVFTFQVSAEDYDKLKELNPFNQYLGAAQ